MDEVTIQMKTFEREGEREGRRRGRKRETQKSPPTLKSLFHSLSLSHTHTHTHTSTQHNGWVNVFMYNSSAVWMM